MKVQHSTTIELPEGVDAVTLKKALDQVPDNAYCTTRIVVSAGDRPWESTRTSASLECVWEAGQ